MCCATLRSFPLSLGRPTLVSHGSGDDTNRLIKTARASILSDHSESCRSAHCAVITPISPRAVCLGLDDVTQRTCLGFEIHSCGHFFFFFKSARVAGVFLGHHRQRFQQGHRRMAIVAGLLMRIVFAGDKFEVGRVSSFNEKLFFKIE
ncbi:hypothetical protein CEXT_84041 [Caerostris extrusa]|uniref:Uncharacterized protein n=1 Tax=Caerostris extrusa TaxID=172846 RepID=A0AAV4N5J5_CAEEX|nr:hypothetical protein CEXT_84041 [Caerostris extrusa]